MPHPDERYDVDPSHSVPRTPQPKERGDAPGGEADGEDQGPGSMPETPQDKRDRYSGGRTGNT